MNFTPDAILAAKSNDELVALFAASAPWPLWHIIETLSQRGADAVDAALRGLTNPHPQVRRWCAELLDHGADDRCIEPLVALMNDPVAHVRWQAAHSLACQRCKFIPLDIQAQVARRMIDLALHDPCVRVRCQALAGLDLRPDIVTPETLAALSKQYDGLLSRDRLSKRERSLVRALRTILRRFGALDA